MILFGGCVGTIKDANSIKTMSQDKGDVNVSDYKGIEAVVAIADTKVEVFFPEVSYSGNISDISYVIRYGGQQVPLYIAANSLKKVQRYNGNGEKVLSYKATVSNLQADKVYEFNVEVMNIKNGSVSSNNSYIPVRTFSNATARFDGIQEVKNLPGNKGINGILVLWEEALKLGTSISKNPVDPYQYQITVLDGSTPGLAYGPADMNNESITGEGRKIYTIEAGNRQMEINGLKAFTKYYVQVRTIHEGKKEFPNDDTYKVEQNTGYLEITTYDPSKDPIITNKDSLTHQYPAGVEGLTAVNLGWINPVGVFDHYRIYYSENNTSPTINAICGANCEVVNATNTTYKLVGLQPKKNYYITLVVCVDSTCLPKNLSYTRVMHSTNPPILVGYKGIQTIDTAKNISSLENLFLNLSLPDFNQGYVAGIDFFGCHSTTASECVINEGGDLLSTTTDISIEPDFDYINNGVMKVGGIDSSSDYPYCFVAIPFVYDETLTKKYVESPLSIPRCKVPEVKAPSFAGFDTSTNCDILKWQTPTSGVFDVYEIYYRKKVNIQSPMLPLTELGNTYQRTIVAGDKIQYATSQLELEIGGVYDFGIRTLYRSSEGESSWLRSNNVSIEQIITCVID